MMRDTRSWILDAGYWMQDAGSNNSFNPSTFQPFNLSTLQPFNLSTLQPFNPSTLKPCNDLTPATLLMDLTRKMKFNIGVVLYLGI